MLAKGRLLGLQFMSLFEDDLYFDMAQHADNMGMLIKEAYIKKDYGCPVTWRPDLIKSLVMEQPT